MKKLRTTQNNRVITIDGDYKDFPQFFETNKHLIYENIINIFSDFVDTKTKKITLKVVAKIDGFNWDSKFNFYRNEYIVLRKDLMPYYEEIEDYETCEKIINLEKTLTNKK